MAAGQGSSTPMLITGIGALYVAQSVIGGMTWTGLPALMRSRPAYRWTRSAWCR